MTEKEKKELPSFFWDIIPTTPELPEFWKNAIFVFDTNVLLDLYRLNNDDAKALLNALMKIKDNVWLPHQVAFEFIKNRRQAVHDYKGSYADAYAKMESLRASFNEAFASFNKNKIISESHKKSFKENFDKFLSKEHERLKKIEASSNDHAQKDEIFPLIKEVFNEKLIGEPYSDDELLLIFKEGDERVSQKKSPAMTDQKKPTPQEQFGDFIIWKQIIDYSIKNKKDIVFVTSELKEDWWKKVNGKTVGLQFDLHYEFYNKTNHRIYAYQLTRFLREFNRIELKDAVKISDEVIKNIHRVTVDEPSKDLKVFKTFLSHHNSINFKDKMYTYGQLMDVEVLVRFISDVNLSFLSNVDDSFYLDHAQKIIKEFRGLMDFKKDLLAISDVHLQALFYSFYNIYENLVQILHEFNGQNFKDLFLLSKYYNEILYYIEANYPEVIVRVKKMD